MNRTFDALKSVSGSRNKYSESRTSMVENLLEKKIRNMYYTLAYNQRCIDIESRLHTVAEEKSNINDINTQTRAK